MGNFLSDILINYENGGRIMRKDEICDQNIHKFKKTIGELPNLDIGHDQARDYDPDHPPKRNGVRS